MVDPYRLADTAAMIVVRLFAGDLVLEEESALLSAGDRATVGDPLPIVRTDAGHRIGCGA